MSDIPTDLFLEILRRVPAEPLFRFRSVCKSWRSIIDDPKFAKLHINRGIGDKYLLLRNDTGKVFLLPLTSLVDYDCVDCVGEGCTRCGVKLFNAMNIETPVGPHVSNLPAPSCNGLILISTFKENCVWLIWNPFTGEWIAVPPLNGETICMGLGYDKVKNDYKVVRAFETHTFIYSVNSGVWRKVRGPRNWGKIREKNGAFADGALHWLAYPEGGERDLEFGLIVSFSLSKERYFTMDLPWAITDYCEELAVGDLSYSLELVAVNGGLFLTFVDFEMNFSMWRVNRHGGDKYLLTLGKNNVSLMGCFLEGEGKALFRYKNKEKFLWYEAGCCNWLKKVYMEVNPDANEEDECEYLYDTFTCQVLSSNLARLKIGDNGADKLAASKGTLHKKRKRADATQRLSLKFIHEEPEPHDTDEEYI